MDSTISPADLDQCVVPLDEVSRRAVRRYWEQVIREELLPVEQAPRAVPLPEDGRRERRQARRAVARIAAAGRARVRALPAGPVSDWSGEAA
jgi:hypothetical protein